MILGRQKIINPLGHKTIFWPSAKGWFCVLRWNNSVDAVVESKEFKTCLVSIETCLEIFFLDFFKLKCI